MKKILYTLEKAPDFTFETPWAGNFSFYNETGNRVAVLYFLRYIGCPVCQMEMAAIRRDFASFKCNDICVFVVLQSPKQSVAALADQGDWPFTLVCDPGAELFKLYQVEAGGICNYLQPKSVIAGIMAMAKGIRHGRFEGNELQLPAVFVVSPEKVVQFVYYGKRIDDLPVPPFVAEKAAQVAKTS